MPLPQNRNSEAQGGLVPPPGSPVRKFDTANLGDGYYVERVDVSARDYVPLVRGFRYSTLKDAKQNIIDQFPTLFFLRETLDPFFWPWAMRYWATDETADATYGSTISFINENVDYPMYAREFCFPREVYEADPAVAPLSPLTGVIGVKVEDGGTGYTADDTVVFSSGNAKARLVVGDNGEIILVSVTVVSDGYDSDNPPTVTVTSANGSGASLSAIIQDKRAVLTSQKKIEFPDDDPNAHEKIKLLLVYETLPGPWDYSTRLDPDNVVVAIASRRNIADDIVSGETSNSGISIKTTKKGEQNSYVATEIVETRGLPGPPVPSVLIGNDLYGAYSDSELYYSTDIEPSVEVSDTEITTIEKKAVSDSLSEKITTVKKWLDDADFAITIPNVIPQWARALIPTRTVSHRVRGVASQPSLGAGEFTRAEKQLDAEFKRVTVETLNFDSLPVVLTNKGLTEKFGGDTTTITLTLNTEGSMTVDEGLLILDSKIDRLGNGMEVKSTEAADANWEEMYGQEYDEGLDVIIPFAEQTITEGTHQGDAHTDIKTEDQWRSRKRTIDISAAEAVLGAYLMQYPSKTNVSMPDKLVALEGSIQSQTGDGADQETGSVAGYGSYSIQLDLRADATASATIMPEVIATIHQFYGANIDCTHFIFFLRNPVTSTDVLNKINELLGESVSAWPKFNPQTLTMLIVGANAALKVNAVSKGSYSQVFDLSSQSSTAGGGTGYSRAKGLTLRRMEISPTIHGELTISGTTNDSVDLNAYCNSEAVGLGPYEAINKTDSIDAFTTPTTFDPTCGATDWPTSGKFLYRVDARPYKYGFVMFHVIVVDAADFPNTGCE